MDGGALAEVRFRVARTNQTGIDAAVLEGDPGLQVGRIQTWVYAGQYKFWSQMENWQEKCPGRYNDAYVMAFTCDEDGTSMTDDNKTQNGWDLIMEHDYRGGYEEYSRQLLITGPDPLLLANRGKAALCLGRTAQAREDYLLANTLVESRPLGLRTSYRETLFAIEWISENPEKAIDHLVIAIEGIKTNRIEYTDAAGGVEVGALLYFAGVRLEDTSMMAVATQFLEHLAASGLSEAWPGPIGLFLQDAVSFDDLVHFIGISTRVGSLMNEANKGLLMRRRICQALFYNGVKRLEHNDIDESTRLFSNCSQLENPILELEWFLAGFELKRMRRA